MITPLAYADSLRIGSVDFVSPDEIKVLLDIEAPSDIALNAGIPRPFPRINSYVLIPCESGFLVSQIEWITIERSQYPKRKGMQDFGVIDLPYPLRKMSLNPLGILKEKRKLSNGSSVYSFSRGVEIYPTVGDPVLLPSQDQLKAIVESGENRRVNIGISPLAGNAVVSIDPDRLFGRHLAILGNTGSGKSCTVAGVIRWSIEAAGQYKKECSPDRPDNSINSRFIILDPNGEYSKAFSGLQNVRLFAVEPDEENNVKQLHVPIWFWNSAEWCAFTQASTKAQRPTLIQALRSVRDGKLEITLTPSHDMRRFLRTIVTVITIEYNAGTPWGGFPKPKSFFEKIQKWQSDLVLDDSYSDNEKEKLENLRTKIDILVQARSVQYAHHDFRKSEVEDLLRCAKIAHAAFGGTDSDSLPIDADIPRPFDGNQLLRSIEANSEIMGTAEHVETMLMRIRTLLSDTRLKMITTGCPEMTLAGWLNEYICPSSTSEGAITIIDLSLVPAEVVHIIAAVIARTTLEALQRFRKINNGNTLPTTIVMEEAHTFIKKYQTDGEGTSASAMCTQVFEKIAREGRKFGLGLVLSSQRPSELSATVLSQCNTFLLHRISNDRDQELVHKLVPDNLRGLLRELPSLPSRNAILMGWASELPVLVQMNYLKEEHRPKSNDPDFWDVWTCKSEGQVNWIEISKDWQQYGQLDEGHEENQIADEVDDLLL
ncbi:ATP-binding protein [Proteiniclasticum ruminis]|uniref:Helicase HerA central domain-containing protein n=1 Tax=Proteiniclasticum ruminis TaxID=398199 RepID=A0A1G8RFE0_9CLOT|nr:DUF87 domain-containing protein [Proteiniclasticum ruminis]SDJ15631.1 hypothetical protein SAMN05421804_10879 [Proteiniclasticum ruminis]